MEHSTLSLRQWTRRPPPFQVISCALEVRCTWHHSVTTIPRISPNSDGCVISQLKGFKTQWFVVNRMYMNMRMLGHLTVIVSSRVPLSIPMQTYPIVGGARTVPKDAKLTVARCRVAPQAHVSRAYVQRGFNLPVRKVLVAHQPSSTLDAMSGNTRSKFLRTADFALQ